MSYQNILTNTEDNILTITINREDKMNALNIQLLQEIKDAVTKAQNDNTVRGIIITGAGTKAFAAGADIAEFSNFSVAEGTEMSRAGHEVFFAIERSSKPVIAAVNGFALGGGCELTLACHLRYASENAKFGQPEINLGVPPGYGGTQRLVQIVGKGRALEILLTTNTVDAQKALHIGLVNEVFSSEELISESRKRLSKIISKSPNAIKQVINCVNDHFTSQHNGFETEIKEFGEAFGTSDFKEGTSAFLEKRKANFGL
ncbi:MAG: enoyl-CoA hydratase/isomerase family protein [Bacteroidetes bacterium]|nr:enoyl-CoA hydratase/isomerase family protein [Bacteroidota bacterium]